MSCSSPKLVLPGTHRLIPISATMPRTPFAIYEDPRDRIPPSRPSSQIHTPRTPTEAEQLLAKAARVVEAARGIVATEQVMEAKEAVERIALEKDIERQEKITADLKLRVGVMETVIEYLSYVIGEREEEIEELSEEAERLRRKLVRGA